MLGVNRTAYQSGSATYAAQILGCTFTLTQLSKPITDSDWQRTTSYVYRGFDRGAVVWRANEQLMGNLCGEIPRYISFGGNEEAFRRDLVMLRMSV
ncbi:MAG: hypothetical protein EOO77_17455 [Oxalobacteraceae bacterium]|nr:MAG: hypothetical protein EOO77_17455 [Oxalobacteraceae bacterium]